MPRPRTITDERLLTAASQVIGREGPGFTLAQVAAAAEVSVGTVAGRFGSKSGLLRALTEHTTTTVAAGMRAAFESRADPVDGLRAAVVVTYLDLGDATEAGNHLGQLGVDLQDPVLRGLVGLHFAAMQGELLHACAAAAPRCPACPHPRSPRACCCRWRTGPPWTGPSDHWGAWPTGWATTSMRCWTHGAADRGRTWARWTARSPW
ncbi:TetR/AcrR family transcriptional regulator [Actinokineospora soli]|uniref:TetR/AcrR family transcriptional regulator n=1 Tax=Actinokineospora soli TaxID=1048753 RepID=A0ABW2TWR4_9PSEU